MTDAVVRYLRELVARCDGPVPLIDELTVDDLGTARAIAAIARAALAWLRSKQPETIRADLRAELGEADQLARWRTRTAWCEFEDSVRQFRHGREHMVSAAELARRRVYREAV